MSGDKIITLKVDGVDIAVQPSAMDITLEYIRNTERALDGTMCIEEVAQKVAIQVVWDFINNADYKKLKIQFGRNLLNIIGTKDLFPDPNAENNIFYLESITAIPKIINNEFYWQNVSVKVVEV